MNPISKIFPTNRRKILLAGLLGAPILLSPVLLGGLMMMMPGHSHKGPLPPLTAEQIQLGDRLRAHVEMLAGQIGKRTMMEYPRQLEEARQYIRAQFEALGLQVNEQSVGTSGKPAYNLEIEIKGTSRPGEILVVGAHYDSTPETPGADDNASGVAAVLELTRTLAGHSLARTVRLVTFVNEEMPYFQSGAMGSQAYARRCRQRDEKIIGMLSLETIGYYVDTPGSQHYPFPFNLFYPDTGNFIGFVGNVASRAFVKQAVGAFRRHGAFPSEGVAAPADIEGIGWSDHWAFWEAGYPALMVTDTAPFRNPFYHTAQDTPEKLDYGRTARVVDGLARVITEMAGD